MLYYKFYVCRTLSMMENLRPFNMDANDGACLPCAWISFWAFMACTAAACSPLTHDWLHDIRIHDPQEQGLIRDLC